LPFLAFLAVLYGGQWLLGLTVPAQEPVSGLVGYAAVLLAAFVAGSILHELGHAIAVRLVGERVLAVELGGQLGRVTFRLGGVPISIGLGLSGAVSYASHQVSPARRATVVAAGPVVNILAAASCLLLPVPRWEASYIALAVLASAVQDLVPGRGSDGTTTDGSKLLRLAAERRAAAEVRRLLSDPRWWERDDAAAILIDGFRLDVIEAIECLRQLCRQRDELLTVYTKPWTLPDRPEADAMHAVQILSWRVLASCDPSADTADLATSRIEWVIDHLDEEHPDRRISPQTMRVALALARFRQRRLREVRELCAEALAADLDADDRASALALEAMARHALLLAGREQLDEALAVDPSADLVDEAARFLEA
jgi:hypothetical protein